MGTLDVPAEVLLSVMGVVSGHCLLSPAQLFLTMEIIFILALSKGQS